jgi:hypothetical protein
MNLPPRFPSPGCETLVGPPRQGLTFGFLGESDPMFFSQKLRFTRGIGGSEVWGTIDREWGSAKSGFASKFSANTE